MWTADRCLRSSEGKYSLKLSFCLKTEAATSRQQGRTLKQLHLALPALAYEGSYDRGAAFARGWRVDQLEKAILRKDQHLQTATQAGQGVDFDFLRAEK